MAGYPDYIAAINGKTFTAQYLYIAQSSAETTSTSGGVTNYSGSASTFVTATNMSGTVQGVDANAGTFTLAGTTYQIHGASADGNILFFSPVSGGRLYLIDNLGTAPTGTVSYATGNAYNTPSPTCFAAGTHIATACGEKTVEQLEAGDLLRVEGGGCCPSDGPAIAASSVPAIHGRAIWRRSGSRRTRSPPAAQRVPSCCLRATAWRSAIPGWSRSSIWSTA